jgi:hypothetical protein
MEGERTTEITCNVIALYKYSVTVRQGKKNQYDHTIVGNTIDRLVEGIVDFELLGFSPEEMKDLSKWFEITDFLVMPCEHSRKGYHLFDIDEFDIAGLCSISEGNNYKIFLNEGIPTPVPEDNFPEEPIRFVHQFEENEPEIVLCGECIADAIYEYSKSHTFRKTKIKKMEEFKKSERNKAENYLVNVLENEQVKE